MKKQTTVQPPVNLVLPNTTVEKMAAITATAKAVYEVAKALNGVNVEVTIQNSTFTCPSGGTAISIETKKV